MLCNPISRNLTCSSCRCHSDGNHHCGWVADTCTWEAFKERMRPAERMPLLLLAARGPVVACLGQRLNFASMTCRLTYRWESSLWLDGRQVYLGGFATEVEAARAYDLAAIGCKGLSAEINFRASDYADILATDLAGLSQARFHSFVQ